MKVKIIGAGSIGNHLANASRAMGWSVDMCDVDASALRRSRESIYPSRYGVWDDEIGLYESKDVPVGGYDLIFIGTPPDTHLQLALKALEEKPKGVLIEKPLCSPSLVSATEFYNKAKKLGVAVFVGYDHVIGKASSVASQTAKSGQLGRPLTLDVEFREHWGGIFAAHPWLSGPEDSYLGFSERGGGAAGEHSHAVNLWQHFAHEAGCGRIVEVQAMLDFVDDGKLKYDRLCLLNLRTETGLVGRCVQDVVTQPHRKWARLQCEEGHVEWVCGKEPGMDVVSTFFPGQVTQEQRIKKTRPDDFKEEMKHIESVLSLKEIVSPISIERGLDTMLVVAASFLSNKSGRTVRIDYSKGYSLDALKAY